MATFRVRVVRTVQVEQEGFIIVEADSTQGILDAADGADDSQVEHWRQTWAEPGAMVADYSSVRPLAT